MYVFENLNIYTSAVGLSAFIEAMVDDFPTSTDYFGDRLCRAARAVPAHVAEAHGHWKDEERREFFWKARESAQECVGLIDVAARQGLVEQKRHVKFRLKIDALQKMIQESLRQTEKKVEPVGASSGPTGLRVLK